MRACQTCVCEQQLGCLDLSGAEVRGPGAQEPSACLGSLWGALPHKERSHRAKKQKSEKAKLCRTNANAGGGTRTPDTRIMIPPVFPVFTGDSADFGRQIGLFCHGTCTKTGFGDAPIKVLSRHREGHALEGEDLGQPVEVSVCVEYREPAMLSGRGRGRDQSVSDGHSVVAVASLREFAERSHRSIGSSSVIAEHSQCRKLRVECYVLRARPCRVEDLHPDYRGDQHPVAANRLSDERGELAGQSKHAPPGRGVDDEQSVAAQQLRSVHALQMVVFVLLELRERLTVEPIRIEDELSKLRQPGRPFLVGHVPALSHQGDVRPRLLHVVQVTDSRNAHDSLMPPIRSMRSRAATPRTRAPALSMRRASTSANRSPSAGSRLDASTTDPCRRGTASPRPSPKASGQTGGSSSDDMMWLASGSATQAVGTPRLGPSSLAGNTYRRP